MIGTLVQHDGKEFDKMLDTFIEKDGKEFEWSSTEENKSE
jgi:hypothetical protein